MYINDENKPSLFLKQSHSCSGGKVSFLASPKLSLEIDFNVL